VSRSGPRGLIPREIGVSLKVAGDTQYHEITFWTAEGCVRSGQVSIAIDVVISQESLVKGSLVAARR
jgi:hypothetical protein